VKSFFNEASTYEGYLGPQNFTERRLNVKKK